MELFFASICGVDSASGTENASRDYGCTMCETWPHALNSRLRQLRHFRPWMIMTFPLLRNSRSGAESRSRSQIFSGILSPDSLQRCSKTASDIRDSRWRCQRCLNHTTAPSVRHTFRFWLGFLVSFVLFSRTLLRAWRAWIKAVFLLFLT